MYYAFSSKTGKMLSFKRRCFPLNALPLMCTERSVHFPLTIPQVQEIHPTYQEISTIQREDLFIAIFNFIEIEEGKFILVCSPEKELPSWISNINNYDECKAAYDECWRLTQTMFLCRDIRGYFLNSNPNFSNICFFIESQENDSCCQIHEINEGIIGGSFIENNSRVINKKYLKRI